MFKVYEVTIEALQEFSGHERTGPGILVIDDARSDLYCENLRGTPTIRRDKMPKWVIKLIDKTKGAGYSMRPLTEGGPVGLIGRGGYWFSGVRQYDVDTVRIVSAAEIFRITEKQLANLREDV